MGWAKLYGFFDYITLLNIWWWITIFVSFLVAMNTAMANQSAKHVRFYRFLQYIFLLFLIASGFKIDPFNTMCEKGYWVSLMISVILSSLFRIARIYVSHRYWHYYRQLGKKEREFAHDMMNPCAMAQE